MKRNILLVVLILGFVVLATAQDRETNRDRRNWQAPEPVTISGSMVVVRGGPALKSGDVTYYVSGITRLIGFVDGLKEGAQVTVEGVVIPVPRNEDFKFIRASKLTLGGKTYDIEPLIQGRDLNRMMGPMGPWGNPGPHGPQRYPWPNPQRPNPQRPYPQHRNRL